MSRRRKTLCHAEIENFLSELQTDTGGDQSTAPIDATQGAMLTKPGLESPTSEAASNAQTEEQVASQEHQRMREHIRDFVKVCVSIAQSS